MTFKGIIDATLREGQQSPLLFDSRRYRFDLEDKKKLVDVLIKLGVSHIEFFSPVVIRKSLHPEEFLEEIWQQYPVCRLSIPGDFEKRRIELLD